MEEKPDSSQPDNQGSTGSTSSSGGEEKKEAPKDNAAVLNAAAEEYVEKVKKFNILSMVAVGLVAVFFFFMIFDSTSYHMWYLMLAIAGGAGFLLYRQYTETTGFEKKVCFYAFIVLCVLFVLRDIGMARRISAGVVTAADIRAKTDATTKLILDRVEKMKKDAEAKPK
jgi:hypothetical protein